MGRKFQVGKIFKISGRFQKTRYNKKEQIFCKKNNLSSMLKAIRFNKDQIALHTKSPRYDQLYTTPVM